MLLFPHKNLIIFHSQYIDSGYLLWAQLLLQFCTDGFETLHVFSSWYDDVHVVCIQLIDDFCNFFLIVNRVIFHPMGVVGWCEGVMYLMSPGRPADIGLQLGKACYPCSR